MSLIRYAIRQCAARAVLGATLAEGRVFQSVIDPISAKVTSERAPVLIVNTDDHVQEGDGRDITGGTARLDLVFEVAIAAKVTASGQDGDGDVVTVTIIEADAGLDLTLDLIEHQIIRALVGHGAWAQLFRRFAVATPKRVSRRGADASGARWAARQIVLTCDTLAEPVGGGELFAGSPWADFIAAMEADDGLAPMAPLIRGILAGDARDWMRGASMLGVSEPVTVDLGFGPIVTDEDGQPIPLSEIDMREGPIG